ncbi:MAG: flp pilus-assembly TadE/G-like family protein [Actinobacteria bacterium]|nr:flp pilus-assembly TadE/G-like family protein [Actinomycetota bacterium]
MSRAPTNCDRGAATVIWLSAISVVVVFGLVGIAMSELASGRAKASAAADLGALAGARHVLTGDPCPVARRVAAANGARLTRCVLSSSDLEVEVSVRATGILAQIARRSGARPPQIRMSARAGQPRSVAPG